MSDFAGEASSAASSTAQPPQRDRYQLQATELRLNVLDQDTSTAELIKLIRKARDALEQGMRVPGSEFFAPSLEILRSDCLELFRRLLLRNPCSSYRRDVVSKLWFNSIYPSIEQYRANIKQFESIIAYTARSPDSGSVRVRRELSKWRARFQKFLQESTGVLLRIVTDLAEAQGLTAVGGLAGLSEFALDHRSLATHAYGFEFVDTLRSELHPALLPAQRATLAIVSKLFVYLGDLSRYRILYTSKKQSIAAMSKTAAIAQRPPLHDHPMQHLPSSPYDMWWPAKNFYLGAIKLAPHRGQSQNQLAVVYGYEKNTLDGVFYYHRALTAMHRFLPAEANLRTILENALRAIEEPASATTASTAADTTAATAHTEGSGYLYYDYRLYPKFTHLRYLFAIHQPTASELEALAKSGRLPANRVDLIPSMVSQLAADISAASTAFVGRIRAGTLDQRQSLVTQMVHVLELQRLCALDTDVLETAAHNAVVAQFSSQLTMQAAAHMCRSLADALADALRHTGRIREMKSEGAMLPRWCARAISPLIQTLAWIVATSARVLRDASLSTNHSAPSTPLSRLRRSVFETIRECNLLDNASALKDTMARARARVNRRDPPLKTVEWSKVIRSTCIAPLAQLLWGQPFTSLNADSAEDPYACSLRLEGELLVGWQLPDGTVWGRGPYDHTETRDAEQQGTDYSALRWRQLFTLLSLFCECVPIVLRACDPLQATAASRGSAPLVVEEDTDDDVGDETICFQGRPSHQQQRSHPLPAELDMVASPAQDTDSQSLPPTPTVNSDDQLVFNHVSRLEDSSNSVTVRMLDCLDIGDSALGAASRKPETSVLLDTDKDEVVSPAMIATSSQYRANNSHGAAIGSRRGPGPGPVVGTGVVQMPLSASASDGGQWPSYASRPSTSPVLPGSAAVLAGPAAAASGASMSAFYQGLAYPPQSAPLQQQYSSAPQPVRDASLQPLSTSTIGSQDPPSQSALLVWQQYQAEYQKKLALQQQLDQQQIIQQQLQQQLLTQQQHYIIAFVERRMKIRLF
ncbi:hypothetical protein GGI07_004554 [Coemansia sp. Benny D115]|nr:hypothetical protein GGI07_004554 [Coemansia sp. Benny D115]